MSTHQAAVNPRVRARTEACPGPEVLSALSDDQVARLAASHPEAWSVLYARSLPHLVRLARRLGWCGDDADDLAQETMVRLWRHRAGFDPSKSFARWARTVLKNLSASRHRQTGRRHTLVAATAGEAEGLWRAVPPASPVEALERRRIRRALESLPDSDRAVLSAWAIGHPSSEMAREEGISDSSMRGRVRRAKLRLARVYDQAAAAHA